MWAGLGAVVGESLLLLALQILALTYMPRECIRVWGWEVEVEGVACV